jgi:hypothetical protein
MGLRSSRLKGWCDIQLGSDLSGVDAASTPRETADVAGEIVTEGTPQEGVGLVTEVEIVYRSVLCGYKALESATSNFGNIIAERLLTKAAHLEGFRA